MKEESLHEREIMAALPSDSLRDWLLFYEQMALIGVRSEEIQAKLVLHIRRFIVFFESLYDHDRASVCIKRDVIAWRDSLVEQDYAPATINNHMSSLSGFTAWVTAQAPQLFAVGDPCKGIRELPLPALEPRALTDKQIQTLKNLCDRLPYLHRLKGGHGRGEGLPRLNARPWRDRAIVFFLLSTGLRREELVNLNLEQLSHQTVFELRKAKQVRVSEVKGKGQTYRNVFLSSDARGALADYLAQERYLDVIEGLPTTPLFLSASGIPMRSADGRLSPRSINLILEQVGRWHDAEYASPDRQVSPLRPHDLRHTFAFQLAKSTGADAYELERRLGHRSQRYIQRYTNPPEEVAAKYIEDF